MSLILDALKKLDRERSSRRKGSANIAVEILKPDLPRPRRGIPLYFVAVPLAAAAITYGVMGGLGFLWKSSPPAPVNLPAQSQQMASASPESTFAPKSLPSGPVKPSTRGRKVASTPPQSVAVPKSSPPGPVTPSALGQQVPPAPPLSREPARDPRGEISRVPPKIQESGESKKPATSPGDKKTTENVIPKEAEIAPGSTKKPSEPAPKEPSTTPPPLKISGIVWHEEPSDRRAVINGTFTKEGSIIEGVKVVEIFPTRVRFSYNGRTFEISAFE